MSRAIPAAAFAELIRGGAAAGDTWETGTREAAGAG
jgi:hypothetical protein